MVATASHGGAVWWMFTRLKVSMVYLQGKSCVIHTSALLQWGSHEEALYKCSAFTDVFVQLLKRMGCDAAAATETEFWHYYSYII